MNMQVHVNYKHTELLLSFVTSPLTLWLHSVWCMCSNPCSVDVYSCLYVLYSGGSAATEHSMISHLYLAQPIHPYPGL